MITTYFKNKKTAQWCVYLFTGLVIGFLVSLIDTMDSIINNFLIFILFSLCIAPLISKRKDEEFDVFNTRVFIPLVYFLYFGAGYYFYNFRVNNFSEDIRMSESSVQTGLLLAIIGIVFFYIGYSLIYKIKKRDKNERDILAGWKQKKILSFTVISLFFFTAANALLWLSIRGIPLFIPEYYTESRTEIMAGKGYFYFIVLAVVPVSLLITALYWRTQGILQAKTSVVLKLLVLAMSSVALLTLLFNVERGLFVVFLVFIFINYHYLKRRLNIKKLAVLFLVMILLAALGGYLRSQQWSENEWVFAYVFLKEMLPEFDNYIQVIENVPDPLPLQFGRTIIPLFTNPIPRFLLPDKDNFKTAGIIFKEFFGHTWIRVGERVTLVGELFMNFHIVGVILGMFLFGAVAAFVQRTLCPSDKNPVKVLLYSLTLMGLISQIAGDIVSATLGYIQLVLPVLAIIIVIKIGTDMKHLQSREMGSQFDNKSLVKK